MSALMRAGAAARVPVVVQEAGDPHWSSVVFLTGFEGPDASTIFSDESDIGHALTASGNAQVDTAQQRIEGSSLLLDGSGDYLSAPDHAGFDLAENDFTLECFVRFSSLAGGADWTFLSKWVPAGSLGWMLRRSNAGSLQLVYSTTGLNTFFISRAWAPSVDTWYHLAVSRIGDDVRVFVDGVQLGAAADFTGVMIFDSTGLFYVGQQGNSSDYMNGSIDEARITNGVGRYAANFTPPAGPFPRHDPHFESVSLLLGFEGEDEATNFVDESDEEHTLAANGDAQVDTAQSKFGGSSLLLDGTGDYLSSPDHASLDPGSDDFTIECFVRFASTSGFQGLLSKWEGANNQRGWLVRKHSDGRLEFFYSTTGADVAFFLRTWSPVVNTWYHLAISRSGDELRFFVNGVQLGVTESFTATIFDSTEPFIVGSQSGTDDFFNGWLDEVRVTKGVGRYTSDFNQPPRAFPRQG